MEFSNGLLEGTLLDLSLGCGVFLLTKISNWNTCSGVGFSGMFGWTPSIDIQWAIFNRRNTCLGNK